MQALMLLALLCTLGHGQTTSRLSTNFLARGEEALLEVSVIGQPGDIPEIGDVKNITIQPAARRPMTRMLPGKKLEYVFEYIVSGYETGKHLIPPIEVNVDGIAAQTEPLEFLIFNPDELEWSEATIGGNLVRYASSFRVLNAQPYENETTPVEIKLFVPEELMVEDWGIPDFEREGLVAWRFQPSPMRSRINLLGRRYISVAYPSTITPTRSGKISIGPAKIRLTTREVVMDPFPRQVFPEVYLQVPKLEIEAMPLPGGAPAGFDNAVGNFRISSATAATEVQEGDPISVDLTVTGSGNLDGLRPPALDAADGWKVYGTTTEQRGDERRLLSGSMLFRQSIRPLEMKSEIPGYRLVYFDPKDKAYKTATSKPIALRMLPGIAQATGNGAVQSLPVPFERMTDILAVLRPAQLTMPVTTALPGWIGHLVGGLIAMALLGKAIAIRCAPHFAKDPAKEERKSELRQITATAGDTEFLKSAGGFIERWLGDSISPEIQAVLAERDAVCFRGDAPKSVLDRKRRDQILKVLQKAAVALTFIFALGLSPTLHAENVTAQAHEAYQSAKYDEAIKLWLGAGDYRELSADTLYNVGNACYRSGSAGHAALYYRRALARDPSHQEASQNLRFIERKYGAITVERQEYQYALAQFPLSTWKAAVWTGLWICIIADLIFPATRPGARIRVAAVGLLIVGPVIAAVGSLGWSHFPDDAEFAPTERQAVVVVDSATLHTDAARTAPEVIDAPPGSLCEIITQSGRWAYIAFATKTRGWVPIESIEKILPDKPPTPPTFSKPKADGKTA